MAFDPQEYGPGVAEILALDGAGQRLMPLAEGTCSSHEAARRLRDLAPGKLFAGARHPQAGASGLWLYFSCLEESHRVSQQIPGATGSYWHGIMHRQEPDPWNSGYWFRRVGRHAVFDALAREASQLGEAHPAAKFSAGSRWDPFAFIDYCEEARQNPGSEDERLAMEIQRAEWQLLFDYCARVEPGS